MSKEVFKLFKAILWLRVYLYYIFSIASSRLLLDIDARTARYLKHGLTKAPKGFYRLKISIALKKQPASFNARATKKLGLVFSLYSPVA